MSERSGDRYPRLVGDVDAEANRLRLAQDALSLKSGDGGGTSGGMEAIIDAKVAAAEARTDAKFATVIAKLDALGNDVRATRGSIWTAAFAIMGLILAVVGLLVTVAPSAFSLGTQYREIARDEARAAQAATVQVAPPEVVAPAK